jgi:hypothetical protein
MYRYLSMHTFQANLGHTRHTGEWPCLVIETTSVKQKLTPGSSTRQLQWGLETRCRRVHILEKRVTSATLPWIHHHRRRRLLPPLPRPPTIGCITYDKRKVYQWLQSHRLHLSTELPIQQQRRQKKPNLMFPTTDIG